MDTRVFLLFSFFAVKDRILLYTNQSNQKISSPKKNKKMPPGFYFQRLYNLKFNKIFSSTLFASIDFILFFYEFHPHAV